MSVDTYLKGKDTSAYQRSTHDDVEVLVSPSMSRVTRRLRVDTRRALFGRALDVEVEHEHGPTCEH